MEFISIKDWNGFIRLVEINYRITSGVKRFVFFFRIWFSCTGITCIFVTHLQVRIIILKHYIYEKEIFSSIESESAYLCNGNGKWRNGEMAKWELKIAFGLRIVHLSFSAFQNNNSRCAFQFISFQFFRRLRCTTAHVCAPFDAFAFFFSSSFCRFVLVRELVFVQPPERSNSLNNRHNVCIVAILYILHQFWRKIFFDFPRERERDDKCELQYNGRSPFE